MPSGLGSSLRPKAMHLRVTTAPASQAVSDAEAVAHAKIDSDAATADSSLITAAVKASILWVEGYCYRSLVTQTITLELDSFEFIGPFYIPRPPFIAVTTLKTFDSDDNATTISSDNYRILGLDPARIEQKADGWTIDRTNKAVELIYTAGYGAASTVPNDIKAAIMLVFADLYENRQTIGTITARLPLVVELLTRYRIGQTAPWT